MRFRTASPRAPLDMRAGNVTLGVRLRVVLDRDIAIGPGKADLLEGVATTGSISAAARGMGMSYKRAWLLVDTMNRCFRTPLVEAAKGGQTGGGARLTPLGREVLHRYRSMATRAARGAGRDLAALRRLLRRKPRQSPAQRRRFDSDSA
ncbi:MAG: winged helix-turn-helix domain-containing protein [Burkholderiales bacterium]